MDEMINDGVQVDAVITDPPFFMPASHYQSRAKSWKKSWSDTSILTTWWREISKRLQIVTKETGHVLVFCNQESYPAFYPPMFENWDFVKLLVWDKGRIGLGHIWRNQHELIIAARNRKHYIPEGKARSEVLRYKVTPTSEREHPAQKPVDLYADLIETITQEGNIVLDPFAGSGTVGIACKDKKRKFIGIELNPEYCEVAKKRIAREIKF